MIDAIDFALSGNGGNVAMALGRLGIDVALAGYSGADVIGDQFREMLAKEAVNTAILQRHPEAGTGTSIITLSPEGERSVLFINGANAFIDLEQVPDEWIQEAKVVSASSIFVLPQFTGKAVQTLFRKAKKHGSQTVLNICWNSETMELAALEPALEEADYFILSYDEGRHLTHCILPSEIMESLQARTAGEVILTLGADGCCVRGSEGLHHLSALPVEASDCTGAGDSFVAGFIAGLVQKRSLIDCARLGCTVASFAVTGPGAYPRIPRLTEIDQIYLPSPLSGAKNGE